MCEKEELLVFHHFLLFHYFFWVVRNRDCKVQNYPRESTKNLMNIVNRGKTCKDIANLWRIFFLERIAMFKNFGYVDQTHSAV